MNITASTIIISNNMKRNAMNTIVIRSHQVDFVGGADNSFDETKVFFRLDLEHVPTINCNMTHLWRLIMPHFQLIWAHACGSRDGCAPIARVDKSLNLKVTN